MAGQDNEGERSAAGPVTNDLRVREELAGLARQLGERHRAASSAPFGDVHQVRWDEASARLMDALGVTSPPTGDNAPGRQCLVDAYCDALEAREGGDAEAGS